MRGKPPVEIHYVNQRRVGEIVQTAGGVVVDIRKDETARRGRKSLFYTVVAPAP